MSLRPLGNIRKYWLQLTSWYNIIKLNYAFWWGKNIKFPRIQNLGPNPTSWFLTIPYRNIPGLRFLIPLGPAFGVPLEYWSWSIVNIWCWKVAQLACSSPQVWSLDFCFTNQMQRHQNLSCLEWRVLYVCILNMPGLVDMKCWDLLNQSKWCGNMSWCCWLAK